MALFGTGIQLRRTRGPSAPAPSNDITATQLAAPLNQVWAPLATLSAPGMSGTPTWEIVSGGTLFALGS